MRKEVKKVTNQYHLYSIFAKIFNQNIIVGEIIRQIQIEGHSTKFLMCTLRKYKCYKTSCRSVLY